MRKVLLSLLLFFSLSSAHLFAQTSSMTDQQVLVYVEQGLSKGKSQEIIAKELARQGVTKEQAYRVKALYEKKAADGKSRSDLQEVDRERQTGEAGVQAQSSAEVNQTIQNVVFGRNIFNTRGLTFEPNANLPTPENYILGPGDEVIIDIWGTKQTTLRQTISPDGNINIQGIGMLSLNGMSINNATIYLQKSLNRIFEGIDGEDASSHIKVTLGNIRTIQVNIMGEVAQPGTYRLSSLSTVFHALYRAGGISDLGSLRSIYLTRNGKRIATIDVYDFILNGRMKDDMRLEEGDVIIVPPFDVLVTIEGNVKRPMKYEMKKSETIEDLIEYAGNFSSDAYQKSIRLIRQNGQEYQVNTVDKDNYSTFNVHNGDIVSVESILNRFSNKLTIKGAVYRPGIYELNEQINTVRSLIAKADGLLGEAFLGRAVLHRQREDMTREVLQIDVKGIMNGSANDVVLQKNDVLYIPSIHDLTDMGTITVYGEVARPGDFVYADNTTLEDIIIQAGGLLESASTVRVDVSRRIKDSKVDASVSTISEMFTFSLKDGFVVDGTPGFVLEPYDQVYVRRSPGYQKQTNVSVTGEILYNGTYALTTKSERLSDLVKKAGGITPYAYVKGAKLLRKATEEDFKRIRDIKEMMRQEFGKEADSLQISLDSIISVGIDLSLALESPGSDADIVLREGDQLVIPELDNTIKINGAVLMPNTVAFKSGESAKYYIGQAGGYANHARKSKAFIIYMNGQVAKVKGRSSKQIEPGCEIVVPIKQENKKWNAQTILGMVSTFASLGLTAASIANILK